MKYLCLSINFVKGDRRIWSMESIYEDDQMVIFVLEDFLLFQVIKKHAIQSVWRSNLA